MNSNLALTRGYLNPALKNSAQVSTVSVFFRWKHCLYLNLLACGLTCMRPCCFESSWRFLKFPEALHSRIKTIVSRKFSRIANAISEPKIGHVTDRRVFYRWWPDINAQNHLIDMLLFIYTVEQAFKTVLKETKLDTDVLEETFAL